MNRANIIQIVGMIAGIALPLWNIPLIVRIHRRKSSHDVSLWWAFGVLVCMVLMLPSAFVSADPVYKIFSIMNFLLFGSLVLQILRYHR